ATRDRRTRPCAPPRPFERASFSATGVSARHVGRYHRAALDDRTPHAPAVRRSWAVRGARSLGIACALALLPPQPVAARTLAPASPASVDAPDPVPGTDVAAARPTVALLRFTGGTGSTGAEQAVRDGVRAALEREGVPVRLVALGREQAASKAKCPTPSDDACLGKIVEWLGT